MSTSVLHFSVTQLRLKKSVPYLFAAALLFWLSFVMPWQVVLLVPGIVFMGLGAAAWSAMRFGVFQSTGGRLPSKERIVEMLPARARAGCPRAINLRIYRALSPFFWVIYSAFCAFVLLETLPPVV